MTDDDRLVPMPLRIPGTMKTQLEQVCQARKMATPSALARLYISEGLARDQHVLQWSAVGELIRALRSRGVDNTVLQEALEEAVSQMPVEIRR